MTNSSDASAVEQALRVARESPGTLLAIVGPTATGKTALAVALAQALGGEVISADSVQIYRGFDIGSGKPAPSDLARCPHHLVGVLNPDEHVDAAKWANLADAAILSVRSRGRVPIVCGGTFLWMKALLFGLAEAPSANGLVRQRHKVIAEEEGRAALHALLRRVDPETALRLHPNDLVRVSRALEVHEMTGRTLSSLHREHRFAEALRPATLLGVACDAALLSERIAERARGWLASGWIDEVVDLIAAGYGDVRAMSSVGYAQVRAMILGRLAPGDLEAAIVRATRIFARRQRTWLNHVDVHWLR